MRVWVLWYTTGPVTGVLDAVSDDDLRSAIHRAGDELRARHEVEGVFVRVDRPEAYWRHDERVYRCGSLTIIARPFTVAAQEALV
jgi:hypothetical protein